MGADDEFDPEPESHPVPAQDGEDEAEEDEAIAIWGVGGDSELEAVCVDDVLGDKAQLFGAESDIDDEW